MKVQNNLKELLAEYTLDLIDMIENGNGIDAEKLADKYCEANSLALGKPEPLAKNKQFGNVCMNCEDFDKCVRTVDGTCFYDEEE